MPLVKWLLLIPHFIVLILLAIGALFAILISFFAVSSRAGTHAGCSTTWWASLAGPGGCRPTCC